MAFCVDSNWSETFQPAGKVFVAALVKCGLQWLFSMPAYTDFTFAGFI